MTTDEEIKALVERLIDAGGDLDLLAVGALQALAARAEAAEKRLAEVEAVQKAKDEQYWLVAENEAKLQEHCDRLESALRAIKHRVAGDRHPDWSSDTEVTRSRFWVANTVDAALSGSSDPRKDVARLEHAVEFTAKMCWRTDPPNANNRLTDSERLSAIKHHPTIKEYGKPNAALDPKEGTDAGE